MRLLRELCKSVEKPSELMYDLSPLQLGMGKHPWYVAIASVLLCRTRRDQARPALRRLLYRYDSPEAVAASDPVAVYTMVRSCGFGLQRTHTLRTLSRQWSADDWKDMRELMGVGNYVADAVSIFCFGCSELTCEDDVLRRYLDSLISKSDSGH